MIEQVAILGHEISVNYGVVGSSSKDYMDKRFKSDLSEYYDILAVINGKKNIAGVPYPIHKEYQQIWNTLLPFMREKQLCVMYIPPTKEDDLLVDMIVFKRKNYDIALKAMSIIVSVSQGPEKCYWLGTLYGYPINSILEYIQLNFPNKKFSVDDLLKYHSRLDQYTFCYETLYKQSQLHLHTYIPKCYHFHLC